MKHKISQPIYIFNRKNSQNSKSPNGTRRGLDFIALPDYKGVENIDNISSVVSCSPIEGVLFVLVDVIAKPKATLA